MSKIDDRRTFTLKKRQEVIDALQNAERFIGGRLDKKVACVYATGSYGRSDASAWSDLDLFIAGRPLETGVSGRELSQLNEICLKAELVEATRRSGLPDFDGDGEYLRHYTGSELVTTLGRPDDDAKNTFTARLLLLLESCPLVGEEVYEDLVQAVVASYWRDYEDHKSDFVPTFLTNDILRLWRTLAVGYEAKTKPDPEPAEKAKRREKNYKLKYSRVLTCFSAIISLTALVAKNGTVGPFDMAAISKKTPIERIRTLGELDPPSETATAVARMEEEYEKFLTVTDSENLRDRFHDDEFSRKCRSESSAFGDAVFAAIMGFGPNNRLVRHLIV